MANYGNSNEQNLVLKGGISNYKYIWRSENSDKTCDKCASLDGTVYYHEDEIPQKPHPNCKCTVEIVENSNEDEEPCDCKEKIDELINSLEKSITVTQNISDNIENDIEEATTVKNIYENAIEQISEGLNDLSQEYKQHLKDCENNIDELYELAQSKLEELKEKVNFVVYKIQSFSAWLRTFQIFSGNYVALLYEAYVLKKAGMDKYYHSKANCEAAQLGDLYEQYAEQLGDFKEEFDHFKNIYARSHKLTVEEALADSEEDQIANRLGRQKGRLNPNCDCAILMWDLLPKDKVPYNFPRLW